MNIIFCCLFSFFLFIQNIYSFDDKYNEFYSYYLNEDYKTVIEIFNESFDDTDNPKVFYYTGMSFFYLKDYENAKKYLLIAGKIDPDMKILDREKYFNSLTAIHDRILENDLAGLDFSFFSYEYFLIFFVLFIVFVLVFIFVKRFKLSKFNNNYSKLNHDINLLNDEFTYIKQNMISQDYYKSDNMRISLDNIEERCIVLNDKLERAKDSKSSNFVDRETFEYEIDFTRKLIQDLLDKKNIFLKGS